MKLIIFIGILGIILAVKDDFDTFKESKNLHLSWKSKNIFSNL